MKKERNKELVRLRPPIKPRSMLAVPLSGQQITDLYYVARSLDKRACMMLREYALQLITSHPEAVRAGREEQRQRLQTSLETLNTHGWDKIEIHHIPQSKEGEHD